jgi:hypothetical protein
MIRRPIRHTRNRNRPDPSNRPRGTDSVATASIVATKLQLDFDQPVSVDGIPRILVQGAAPTSVVQDNATRVTLDYAAAVVATNILIIPANDPAIRTRTGGYVVAGSEEL